MLTFKKMIVLLPHDIYAVIVKVIVSSILRILSSIEMNFIGTQKIKGFLQINLDVVLLEKVEFWFSNFMRLISLDVRLDSFQCISEDHSEMF